MMTPMTLSHGKIYNSGSSYSYQLLTLITAPLKIKTVLYSWCNVNGLKSTGGVPQGQEIEQFWTTVVTHTYPSFQALMAIILQTLLQHQLHFLRIPLVLLAGWILHGRNTGKTDDHDQS
jgi:hypothetical protein